MSLRIIQHFVQQSNLRSTLPKHCLLLLFLLVFACASAFSSPLQVNSITLGGGMHTSIVAENIHSLSAVLQLERSPFVLDIGYRSRMPVQDVSLHSQLTLGAGMAAVLYLHTSFGTADSILSDLVLGYEQVFAFKGVSFTYALGIQASYSFLPFLEKPLFNASPYLAAKIGYKYHNRFHLSLFSTTSTFFDYACQSISPIIGSTCVFSISEEFAIGATYFIQLSDVSPEAVLITSKEVSVHGTYKRSY